MAASSDMPLLDLQKGLWKARARVKQKWLERKLAEPPDDPREVSRRQRWVQRALNAVKHGQAEIAYRAALADAYSEHLSVLEMILIGASEQKPKTPSGAGTAETREKQGVPANARAGGSRE
jgi:hypothetical protein